MTLHCQHNYVNDNNGVNKDDNFFIQHYPFSLTY